MQKEELIVLDLFCGGGGAGMGYRRAGFTPIGVDIEDRSKAYGHVGEFHRLGWEEGLERFGAQADLIHASPPCQHHSQMSMCRPGLNESYPDLIPPVREALIASGKPYVIENVVNAPLRGNVISLCGWMFGFKTYRHRQFETSKVVPQPDHFPHVVPGCHSNKWKPGTFMLVAGHCSPITLAREVMDIDWMTRDELVEAIPPYFTDYVGRHMCET